MNVILQKITIIIFSALLVIIAFAGNVSASQSTDPPLGNFPFNSSNLTTPVLYFSDTGTSNISSGSQAYAMLQAVSVNDINSFNQNLNWISETLKLPDKYLFARLYGLDQDKQLVIKEGATSSQADEDIALSLLLAYNIWDDERYYAIAKSMINDIWDSEVVTVGEKYVLTSGSDAKKPEGYLINPYYFSPATYRIFALVDKTHPWDQLAEDSYDLLTKMGDNAGQDINKSVALPPNWVLIDKSGNITSARAYKGPEADLHGDNAYRIVWRVSLDKEWFKASKSENYLSKIEPLMNQIEQSNPSDMVKIYSPGIV